MLLAHAGHWLWQLLIVAPFLLIAGLLLLAQFLDRRNPSKYERKVEEQAERDLDEILYG